MALARVAAALVAAAAVPAAAVTLLPGIGPAWPAVANPSGLFPGGEAPGWRFADLTFVDGMARAEHPDVPSLAGFDDPECTGLLAVGGAEVFAVVPRPLTRDEAIRDVGPSVPQFGVAALGVFDAASGQSLADHSFTIGGFSATGQTTFRFAGQVGADESD